MSIVSTVRSISPRGVSATARSRRPAAAPWSDLPQRAAAGHGEVVTCARSQRAVDGQAELVTVPACLLEVVADDLVELDEIGAVALEPRREALVQRGPRGLGQRVVGGVSNEEVPEAEAVLAGDDRGIGRDQLLAHQRRRAAE